MCSVWILSYNSLHTVLSWQYPSHEMRIFSYLTFEFHEQHIILTRSVSIRLYGFDLISVVLRKFIEDFESCGLRGFWP